RPTGVSTLAVPEHRRLDVLVNNAGIMQDVMLGMIQPELLQAPQDSVYAPSRHGAPSGVCDRREGVDVARRTSLDAALISELLSGVTSGNA
ncbi:MAG TPA: hypothetical protein VKB88_04885, partial [Bryobacteraceae bacterium]|nr:hypothetical protein [Bryobacteraceae bacterium]